MNINKYIVNQHKVDSIKDNKWRSLADPRIKLIKIDLKGKCIWRIRK